MDENQNEKNVRTVNRIGFIAGYFVALTATIIIKGEFERDRLIPSILVFTICWVIGSIIFMRIARWGREKP